MAGVTHGLFIKFITFGYRLFKSMMMDIQENVDLFPYNTFHLTAVAKYFTVIRSVADAQRVFASDIFKNNKALILGGGSNMLLTQDFDGLVVKNELKGIEIIEETDDQVLMKVQSGEGWHALVTHC